MVSDVTTGSTEESTRTRDAGKLETELEESRREIEDLMYSVSHDLRAPLRNISGFSQLLARKYRDRLEGQGLDYIERINSGVARMERMIDDLLKLSRMGRAELAWEGVDLSAEARAIIDELGRAEPERRVEVEIQPEITAFGDTRLLRTALRNLLENSWKFTGRTPEPRISFRLGNEKGKKCYCVQDNGAGFAMNQVGRLFRPFQRLHLESEFPGVGMGLALVKKAVERHGGMVWAEGAEGSGALFCFTLAGEGK